MLPPRVGVAGGVALMAAMLLTDRKRAGYTSPGLALPIIWLVLGCSKSLAFWIHGTTFASTAQYKAGSPLDRDALIILMAAGVFILANREIVWSKIIRANRWLIALYVFMALSIVWSHFHVVSAKRWFRVCGDVIMALIILTDENPMEALRVTWRRSAIIMLPISIILIKYVRQYGVQFNYNGTLQQWTGITTDKNTLGLVCAFTMIFLVWDLMFVRDRRTRFINILLFIMAFYMLMGSHSSRSETSVVCAVAGIGFVIAYRVVRGSPHAVTKAVLVATLIVIAIPFVVLFSLKVPLLGTIFGFLGRNKTFTGREFLWQYLLAIAAHHKLGVGYGGIWIGNAYNVWTTFQWGPTEAHNGYIDVYVQLGAIGILLLSAFVLTARRRLSLLVGSGSILGVLLMVTWAVDLIHNATESSILRGDSYLWTLLLVTTIHIPRTARWDLLPAPKPAPAEVQA